MKTQNVFLSALLFLCFISCKKESSPIQASRQAVVSSNEAVFNSVSSLYKMNITASDFFGATIDNPWFPLTPGTIFHYINTITDDGETSEERITVTVTYDTKIILGISCRVVHDQVKVDGKVTEDTYDWYSQDRFGDIWYFGEDTKEFGAHGKVDSSGSFEAGVNGALPGIAMFAHPEKLIGFTYYQEYFPGNAVDQAQVLNTDATADVAYGIFTNCLKTKEFTALEPGVVEKKFYSYGLGQVLTTQDKGGDEREELVSISHY